MIVISIVIWWLLGAICINEAYRRDMSLKTDPIVFFILAFITQIIFVKGVIKSILKLLFYGSHSNSDNTGPT